MDQVWALDLTDADWETTAGQVYEGTPTVGAGNEVDLDGIDGVSPTLRAWVPAGVGERTGMDRRWSLPEMGVGGLDDVFLRYKVHIPTVMITDTTTTGDKFPGLFGKDAAESPFDLAHGGNRPGDSWSVRPIIGDLATTGPYFYVENPNFNDPFGTAFYTATYNEGWNELLLHYQMNTPGTPDGVFEMWLNDQLIYRNETVEYQSDTMSGINATLLVAGMGTSAVTAALELHFADFELLVPV